MSGTSPSPEFSSALVALLPRLRRYARVLIRDGAFADDLVQDTLERAWARHGQWRPGTDLRAWLFAIMHNRRIDLARGDRFVVAPFDDEAPPELPRVAPPASPIEGLDLQRAFARLSVEHREVLMLVGVEQLSYEEAAHSLGVPIGTVMSRLSRARARLREELDPRDARGSGDGDPPPRLTRIK
jgi:RNA polymerase sigma-70 factor (ECF subfamily)